MHGTADAGGMITQNFMARRQYFFNVAKFFSDAKHGGDLWWQKTRHFFQSGAECHAAFNVCGQKMKTHADGSIPALGDGQDHFFGGHAAFERAFEQFEK